VSNAAVIFSKLADLDATDDGTMNQNQRRRAIDTIKEDPQIRIILMSFKAGGVGEYPSISLPFKRNTIAFVQV
jgi:hypothetical protein